LLLQLGLIFFASSGTTVVLTFTRKDETAQFDVPLVRSGLVPPAAKPEAAAPVAQTSAAATAPVGSNTGVMHSLYSAVDEARLDLSQKEDEVSSLMRQLQNSASYSERERHAAASVLSRKAHLEEMIQQLDEETQVLYITT
jgi:uncharacterized NAD(P)/FAD-binding protein YdhS